MRTEHELRAENAMNPQCNLCKHQRSDNRGGVECGRAVYHDNGDGYGKFKHGATCVHDADLGNRFEPRGEPTIDVANLSARLKHLSDALQNERYINSTLRDRLIKVEPMDSTGGGNPEGE